MASLIPGYEYDIFISYRQKDNKYDGWVTEFVDHLKAELESTFKEEVSVYFDINPHDGLLETHDVNASLKDKLKCLIFIPVISRTYCDPKSFAWEHEFRAFVEQTSQDRFGLKVKLPSGNVASRVLPIRIYDLDNSDFKLCESLLGGVLRGVEFIYKEPGVNRPLRANEDNPHDNLNHTLYRNQINKTANAIKEIIQGLSSESAQIIKDKDQTKEQFREVREDERRADLKKPSKSEKLKLLPTVAIVTILIIAAILIYPKIFKRDTLESLRSKGKFSVAVMPFQNMTNDTIWNIWQEGIQENVITYLSSFPDELMVRETESINDLIQGRGITNYASITPNVAKTISQKLDADVFISGSIQQAGTKLRVNARLIDTKTEEVLKSFEIDGLYNEEMIFDITDSLRENITNFLILSVLKKDVPPFSEYKITTTSPKAFRYFNNGQKAQLTDKDYPAARDWYLKALALDSNFFYTMKWISQTYQSEGLWDKAKEWMQKYYNKRDQMPRRLMLRACRNYAYIFGTPYDEIKYSKELVLMDNQDASAYYHLGLSYMKLFQYDKAIPEFEKSLELHNKMGFKFSYYADYGHAYHETGQYKKEKRLYKKAEQIYPDDPDIIRRQAILSLSDGKTNAANEYIDKYISLRKESRASEITIALNLASIYSDAGILDKAEGYYQQALSIEPDNLNLWLIFNTSWFFIDKNRDINEGLKIIDRALESSPDDWVYLGVKGVGLNKLGKYKEALELLEKSYSLRTLYFHPFFLHLEAAKKAVAAMK